MALSIDLVSGIVRRPDPVPCPNCAVGESDMCRNGQYIERGIKEIHGFMSERWRIEPEYAIKVDPSLEILGVLLEPTTVIIKALEQVLAVGQRAFWEPKTILVTGAGPIGLLPAAVVSLGGFEVHVLDRVETGLKPDLVRALGASYHSGSVLDLGFEPDVIVECTGVGSVIADSIQKIGAGGVICLTGVGSGGIADIFPSLEARGVGEGDVSLSDRTVLVIGLGVMGQLNILAAKRFGAGRIIGSDMVQYRLKKAKEFGADDVIDVSKENLMDSLRLTNGDMADLVIVCPNSAEAMKQGISSVGSGGTVLFFTPAKPDERLIIDPNYLYFRDIKIITSYSCGPVETREALMLIEEGVVSAEKLITHRFPIEKAAEAFRLTGTLPLRHLRGGLDADLERWVELRYSVRDELRRTTDDVYCIGGPANTPHIWAQHYMLPGTERVFSLVLPDDKFRVRALRLGHTCPLNTDPAAGSQVTFTYRPDGWFEMRQHVRPGLITVRLRNEAPHVVVVVLEPVQRDPRAITAAQVMRQAEYQEILRGDGGVDTRDDTRREPVRREANRRLRSQGS